MAQASAGAKKENVAPDQSAQAKQLEKIKTAVRALVFSAGHNFLTIGQCARDYRDVEFREVNDDLVAAGFTGSFTSFLYSINGDYISMFEDPETGATRLQAISSEQTKHLEVLVEHQKRGRLERFSGNVPSDGAGFRAPRADFQQVRPIVPNPNQSFKGKHYAPRPQQPTSSSQQSSALAAPSKAASQAAASAAVPPAAAASHQYDRMDILSLAPKGSLFRVAFPAKQTSNIRALLKENPNGIGLHDFAKLYQAKFGEFRFQDFKVTNSRELYDFLPKVFPDVEVDPIFRKISLREDPMPVSAMQRGSPPKVNKESSNFIPKRNTKLPASTASASAQIPAASAAASATSNPNHAVYDDSSIPFVKNNLNMTGPDMLDLTEIENDASRSTVGAQLPFFMSPAEQPYFLAFPHSAFSAVYPPQPGFGGFMPPGSVAVSSAFGGFGGAPLSASASMHNVPPFYAYPQNHLSFNPKPIAAIPPLMASNISNLTNPHLGSFAFQGQADASTNAITSADGIGLTENERELVAIPGTELFLQAMRQATSSTDRGRIVAAATANVVSSAEASLAGSSASRSAISSDAARAGSSHMASLSVSDESLTSEHCFATRYSPRQWQGPKPASTLLQLAQIIDKKSAFDFKDNVKVTAIRSPDDFCFCYSDLSNDADQFLDNVRNFYCFGLGAKSDDYRFDVSEAILAGTPVMVFAADLSDWKRALVLKTPQSTLDVISVYLCDLGSIMEVQRSALRKLLLEFLAFPFQAVRARLCDVRPLDNTSFWPDRASKQFATLALGITFAAFTSWIDGSFEAKPGFILPDGIVSLFLQNLSPAGDYFINEKLGDDGFAESVTDTYDVDKYRGNKMAEFCKRIAMLGDDIRFNAIELNCYRLEPAAQGTGSVAAASGGQLPGFASDQDKRTQANEALMRKKRNAVSLPPQQGSN